MIGLGLSVSRRRWPSNAPTRVFDFIADPVIPAGWTFSRASTATYYTEAGLLVSAGQNVPRFDHNPATGEALGLLVEASRTNLVASSLYSGSRWTKNGTSTRTDGIDSPDGTMSASRFVTACSTCGLYTVSNSSASTNYVASSFARHVSDGGGGHSIEIGFDTSSVGYARFDTQTNAVLSKGTAVIATGYSQLPRGWARYWDAFNCGPRTSMTDVMYGTTDYTFDAWGAQLEQGSYPSSLIPTQGVAATRAADYLNTSDLSWMDPQNGTLVFDGALMSVLDGGMFAFSLDDGMNNGIGIYKINGSGSLNAYSGSANGTPLGLTVTDTQRFRAGIAWSGAGASASACVNGLKPVAVIGAQAINAEELCLGGARNHQFASNVLVRSLTYWPRRLSDTELAATTALT